MEKLSAAPSSTPPSFKGGDSRPATTGRNQFMAMAVTMSWQLAVAVLVPVIGGVQLDKVFGTSYVCTFIGLAVALAGSGLVMWQAVQTANRLPVPKLSSAQKKAIQKQYEEDDD